MREEALKREKEETLKLIAKKKQQQFEEEVAHEKPPTNSSAAAPKRRNWWDQSHSRFLSTQTGPILCCKPVLRSTVPLLCPTHMQVAEKHLIRALKRAGLNISSTKRLAPKFHVVVAEYVRQIQTKRRAARKATVAKDRIDEEMR